LPRRRTNPRQENFEKEATEMENGGGKDDVPQDANERKNPLPRAMYSTQSSVVLHLFFSGFGVDYVAVS
jgi:hypothetical protein